jgi:hypothetical protein
LRRPEDTSDGAQARAATLSYLRLNVIHRTAGKANSRKFPLFKLLFLDSLVGF